MTAEEREQLVADRVREGLEINPETAEVTWYYIDIRNPYGFSEFPEGETVGRGYFACRPGGSWVSFYDLPDVTRDAFWQKFAEGRGSISDAILDEELPF